MSIDVTLPQLLRRNAERMADRPALREKDLGIWQPYSWRRYWEEVRDFAAGLAASGFGPGDKLSVIGENRPRLYFAQLAAQSLGGIAVPVYQDAIATELAYVLDHAETAVVVAENQEQVDKILSLKDRLPHLKLIVYDDPRGLRNYDDPILKSYEAITAEGCEFAAAHSGCVDAAIAAGKPDDLALFSYTSGTTSRPKGVMLSHANLLSAAAVLAEAEGVRPSDEHLSYLPMAWVGNSLISLALHLWIGFTISFPEKPETLQRDLRELGPTIALAPPRYWENALTAIMVRAADATPLKRHLFNFFRRVAERAQLCASEGQPIPFGLRLSRRRRGGGLWPAARSARAAAGPPGLHRRRSAWRRDFPLLPLDRGEFEAGLRRHRAGRPVLGTARWRGRPRHGRSGVRRGRDPDR